MVQTKGIYGRAKILGKTRKARGRSVELIIICSNNYIKM